jgi:uncharacterized NAD-dependent epimerase/dehydratase family protein
MEGAIGEFTGKLGYGVLRYSPNEVACVLDSRFAGKRLQEVTDSPRDCTVHSTIDEAIAAGANVLVLGIAPPGGLIPSSWWPVIDEAVAKGMSVVNGLHDLLGPRYSNLKSDQWIWDIRIEPEGLAPATGSARTLPANRLLMVGTDMGIGKMTAGLEILTSARAKGIRTEFVATGQIGILLLGSGVPLDAVRVDFAGGSIEREMMRYPEAELIIVEGQGSLLHPGSTATLPLIRGSMATHLILCHKAGMTHLQRVPEISIPPLLDLIRLYEDLGESCGTFPRPQTVAVALNTSGMASDSEATAACASISEETGLPCSDPVRFGGGLFVESLKS